MIEREIDIATADGPMNTFVCHPEEGGPFPAVLIYMDAPGLRQELYDIASRIATVGYLVYLPNLYHRSARTVDFSPERAAREPGMREAMMAMVRALTFEQVHVSTAALLDAVARDPMARPGPLAAVGYCMSGRWIIAAAAAFPDRFGAIASYFGTRLVTDQPTSPHLTLARVRCEGYYAFAESDEHVPLPEAETIRARLAELGLPHRFELYPGTGHGFTFRRGHYDRAATERHFERLFALLRRTIG